METAQQLVGHTGAIENVAVLDLTGLTSADPLAGVTDIRNVTAILVPEAVPAVGERVAALPKKNIAAIVPIPAGSAVKVLTGQVTIGGDALANAAGQDTDVLVVVGQLTVTGPVSRVGYRRLVVVGEIVAPTGSESAIGGALGQLVGATIYYPWTEGAAVQVLAGDVRLAAEALANAGGGENDVLVVAGMIFVTGPVTAVGYRRLIVAGQLLAPKESEPIIGPRLHVTGQVIYYTGTPRRFTGSDRFSRAFFELLDGPVTLILQGGFVIEADVTLDLVRAKLSGLVLQGELRAPREVVPLLQVLATEKQGTIAPLEAAQKDAEQTGDRA